MGALDKLNTKAKSRTEQPVQKEATTPKKTVSKQQETVLSDKTPTEQKTTKTPVKKAGTSSVINNETSLKNESKKSADEKQKKSIKVSNKRKLGPALKDPAKILHKTWPAFITQEASDIFIYKTATENTTKKELINRIIECEKGYVASHPEYPTKEFVMENLRRPKTKHDVKEAFAMSDENITFAKEQAKKCGFKLNGYLEYLIQEYCQ